MPSPTPLPPETVAGCDPSAARLQAYLAGDLGPSEQVRLRSHLAGCSPCRGRFDDALSWAARLHRTSREEPQPLDRRELRRRRRARAVAGAIGLLGGQRGARLRLLLLPAFAVFLFTQVARGPRGAEGTELEALAGTVRLGERSLATPTEPARVLRGELCATGPEGRALLTSPLGSVELAADTWVWLEASNGPRVRLGGGELIARGQATLTSAVGVIEVRGAAARVRLGDSGRLEVEALIEGVRVADSRGEHVLDRGAVVRLPGP